MKMRKLRSSTPRTGARISAGNTEEFIEFQEAPANCRPPNVSRAARFPCRTMPTSSARRGSSPWQPGGELFVLLERRQCLLRKSGEIGVRGPGSTFEQRDGLGVIH